MKKQLVNRSADDMLKAFEYKLYQMKANSDNVESATEVEASGSYPELEEPINPDLLESLDEEEDYFDPFNEGENETGYELLSEKDIKDSDGFWTKYCLYKTNDGRFVTVYGDPDIYRPQDGYFDAEFDTLEEAEEWFYDYNPWEDEEETW